MLFYLTIIFFGFLKKKKEKCFTLLSSVFVPISVYILDAHFLQWLFSKSYAVNSLHIDTHEFISANGCIQTSVLKLVNL